MNDPKPQNILDSPQWVSQSTATAIPEAGGSISPSGTDGPQPQPKDFTLTASPGILCCGVGEKITVTATATGFNAENEPVSVTTPNGTTTGTRSASREYTIKDTDCGTVLSFFGSGPGEEPKKYAKVPVVKLTTETEAGVPHPRSRKKLGVAETSAITLTPTIGTVEWMIVGLGATAPLTGHLTNFSAPDETPNGPADTTISATFKTTAAETIVPKQIVCAVTFRTFEPSGAKIIQWEETVDRHKHNTCSAGFWGKIFILPEDVCFKNIQVGEGECYAILTGYWEYLKGTDSAHHRAGVFGGVNEGTDEHPSVVSAPDDIYTEGRKTPFGQGTFTFNIPFYYIAGAIDPKKFTELIDVMSSDETGTATLSKGGYTTSPKSVSDDDSGSSMPPN